MFVIVILKAVDSSFSMKLNSGLIPQIFKSSVNYAKACIIYSSLLLLFSVVSMELQEYTHMTQIYLFTLLDVVGKRPHRSE